ncbi:DUF362 domain-containing protein, partial [Thermodesulfobacteriota bacterium]
MSKVAITRCPDYDPDRLYDAVSNALELIGGLDGLVGKGTRVLIKANLLMAAAPENAVTTYPAVVETLVRIIREAGGK